MSVRLSSSKLSSKKRYLQIALNSTIEEAEKIIGQLPISDRILLEVGTPYIKRYGEEGIRYICRLYEMRLRGIIMKNIIYKEDFFDGLQKPEMPIWGHKIFRYRSSPAKLAVGKAPFEAYVIADLKTMDRGETEVEMAARAGASAAIALGAAPKETLDIFIATCNKLGLDAMIDMMNVEYPLAVLRQLKKIPAAVVLHRGVDEEHYNRQKMLPLHEIRRLKGSYDIMVAMAGGDSIREVQSAVFNDADIVVVWKAAYKNTSDTVSLIEDFLKQIK